jgi:general secretion pathway protein A
MDYFKILSLNKEPFSNSPDPEFFFHSRQHQACLQKLEISLRLRRGLSVVIGEVGTGKTTLCRQMIRRFADDETAETHLILDPSFSTPSEFLMTVAQTFGISDYPASAIQHPASSIQHPASGIQHPASSIQHPDPDDWQLKESIRQYLFRSGAEEGKTVILIIDEGQKLPGFCIEILREFLNYETNIYKLLQIAIFAQREFEDILRERPNFADRADLYHVLEPLNFTDTREMIRFRLDQSGRRYGQPDIFTYLGMRAIYRSTRGYPRKIVSLCHRVVLTMIIQNRSRAGWAMVRSCAKRNLPISPRKPFFYRSSVICVLFALLAAFFMAANHFGKLWVVSGKPPVGSRESSVMSGKSSVGGRESSVVSWKSSVGGRESSVVNGKSSVGDRESSVVNGKSSVGDRESSVKTEKTTDNKQQATNNKQQTTRILGEIAVERGKTLGGLMRQIYGTASPRYQEAVLRANPQMTSPDRLIVGQRIAFPAIPFDIEIPEKRCWIEIADTESLEGAIRMSDLLNRKSGTGDSLSFQMIPYQNRRGEVRFKIVLSEYFPDENAARNRMKALPDLAVSGGRILSSWDDGTIFFANPY